MAYETTQSDPFASAEACPSLSFRDVMIGTTYTGVITQLPQELQERDYATGKPVFWDDGSPRMTVVLRIKCVMADGTQEERSIWAKKPSSMFRALGLAQKAAGARFALGGKLSVTYTGSQEAKNPRHNAQKLYEAHYEPPAQIAGSPWDSSQDMPPKAAQRQLVHQERQQVPAQSSMPNMPKPNTTVNW
jgi:hypothetical protein